MSGNASVPSEVQAILKAAGGGTPVRPNTPVLPLESPYATATFIDPSVDIITGKRMTVGQKDYVAPNVVLNARNGLIVIGSSSTIQDDAQLLANPGKPSGTTGIVIGDNVVVGDGAVIKGPAAIGAKGGAATSIGANAIVDGAIISPGAFVGSLARVGPGVTLPTGYRVLAGANVVNNAEASTPSLGYVVKVVSTDGFSAAATKEVANSAALASGYATLYQGNSATGGAASAGPIPSAISAAGSTIFFGALNSVEGASSEPTSTRGVPFEPASGSPTFLTAGTQQAIPINLAYKLPARVIGPVSFTNQSAKQFQAALGGVGKVALSQGDTFLSNGDTIRADEGQPITIGSIASFGKNVSIHSPGGGVMGTTTTTVITTTTITATGVTTTTTNASTLTSFGVPTAVPSTTTVTTAGTNAAGLATTGTVTTTVATKSSNLGAITIGQMFTAGTGVVILGSPTAATTFGDGVTVGAGAVVIGSTVGNGAILGSRDDISGSAIPAGAVIPDGAIIINNKLVGFIED